MKFSILTIFPNSFSYLDQSILGKAKEKKLIEIELFDIRDFSKDKHKKVDDAPYGGDQGMVMTCQPIFDAVNFLKKKSNYKNQKVIFFSPRGETLKQKKLENFSEEKDTEFILLCGRYEGVDQRVVDLVVDEEISIGDFVLTGGEIPAMIFVDGIARLLKGVIGKEESHQEESFSSKLEGKKEFPYYTRPEIFEGLKVPEVLLSGHHKKIREWKRENLRN